MGIMSKPITKKRGKNKNKGIMESMKMKWAETSSRKMKVKIVVKVTGKVMRGNIQVVCLERIISIKILRNTFCTFELLICSSGFFQKNYLSCLSFVLWCIERIGWMVNPENKVVVKRKWFFLCGKRKQWK